MSLNPAYMIAPSLQEFFIDKLTNLPLSAGQVTFYSDVNRTLKKNIYTISGNPPNYQYKVLPNPVTLSASGTFTDGMGNDVLPYYYPYDSLGNIELYYITVDSFFGVRQFTREGYPNFTSSSQVFIDVTNYVANGQFLLHNSNQPLVTTAYAGTGIDYTPIAQGGWYFARSHGSSATDVISFPPFVGYVNIPLNASPKFSCEIKRSVANADSVCDLRLRFPDVNKFSSTTQQFLYLFTAKTNNSSSLSNVTVNVYYYYGVGGSTPVTTSFGNAITITPNETSFQVPIVFGVQSNKTIGSGGDDYVEICINLNAGSTTTFDVQFTDVILTPNDGETITQFPPTPNWQFNDASVAGYAPTPDPTGLDLYLPLILTPQGSTYDHTRIGQVTSAIYSSTYSSSNNFPQLLCDGSSYVTGNAISKNNYSSLGIPYARLGALLIANSTVANTPMYGTGANFATAYGYAGNTGTLRISVNSNGTSPGVANNGNTGWTVTEVNAGTAAIGYTAYTPYNTDNVLCVLNNQTPHSGNLFVDGGGGNATGFIFHNVTASTALPPDLFSCSIDTVSAASLTRTGSSAKYFTFSSSTTDYYMYFVVTNEAPPTPGGTGIEINLTGCPTATAQDVANVIREAMNAYEVSNIVVSAAPTASQYFSFFTNPATPVATYYVWYTVNGVGTDPAQSGTPIKVAVLSTDTPAQVVTKTLTAINAYQYAVPDLRGMFLRGLDPNGTWDVDVLLRWSNVTALSGANLGTFEFQQILAHAHGLNSTATAGSTTQGGSSGGGSTSRTGGNENRPVNAAVNFFIYY